MLLSPVVGAGLGVYQDAEQFRSVLLEADFQFGLNVVHPSQGKIVGQCAMARDVHPSADALDNEVVNVDDFGKLRGHGFKAMFEFRGRLWRSFDIELSILPVLRSKICSKSDLFVGLNDLLLLTAQSRIS